MTIALIVVEILCIVGLPVPIVWLTRKNKILGIIGAIACCYIVGFAFSTLGLFQLIDPDKQVVDFDEVHSLTETIAYVLVALSIPLILFSIDLRAVKKLTKGTIIGYALCIVAVLIVAVAMFFITLSFFPSAHLSSMIVGLYTGGTPNLNAIGLYIGNVMGIDKSGIASVTTAANVSDTIVGGIYFLLLISVAPKFYRLVLNRKKKPLQNPVASEMESEAASSEEVNAENPESEVQKPPVEEKHDDYKFGFSIKDKKSVLKLLGAFGLAVGCLGVGAVLELIFDSRHGVGNNLLYILLSVSVLGVAFSFIKPIREIKGQYTLGMYLILMFSLALSMSIDWTVFLTDILPTLAFFACAQVAVIFLHMLLCLIFRIDGDTAIITSTAGVYGPPFIAPVAKASNRPDLIAPGVICGAVGLAIGTLLGVGMGHLFLLI